MAYTTPQYLPDNATPVVMAVRQYVSSGIDNANGFANTAFGQAIDFMGTLQSIIDSMATLPTVDVILGPVTGAVPVFNMPTPPEEPDGMEMNLPEAPSPFTPPALATVDLPQAPTLEATPPTITLPTAPDTLVLDMPIAPELTEVAMPEIGDVEIPEAPTHLSVTVPTSPSISLPTLPTPLVADIGNAPALLDVAVPTAPDVTLPDVPTLIGITIPTAPTLAMPTFTATVPEAPTEPGQSFAWSETADYETQFFTDLRETLGTWITGASTGIDPAVESRVWNRSRARAAATTAKRRLDVTRAFAANGWRKPPGVLARELAEAAQEGQDADLNVSRDVAIAQADLEQKNRQFAIAQGIQTEMPLIQYRSQVQQRAYEAAKYVQEVAIQVGQLLVQRYQAEVGAYESQAKVFDTLVRAELAKLEIFKTELEAQKLVGDLNVQQVEIYKARVLAIGTIIDIFKARVEAANVALNGNKLRVEAFGAEVNAFEAKAKAKSSEYQGYEAAARAELTKAEIYKAEVDGQRLIMGMNEVLNNAYRTRVEASGLRIQQDKVRVDAAVAQDGMNRARVDRYQAMVSGKEVEVRAHGVNAQVYEAVARAQGVLQDLYGKIVEAYKAETMAFGTTVDALTKSKELEIKTSVDAPLQAKKIEGEIYGDRVRAEGIRVDAEAKVYGSRVQVFDAQVRGEGIKVGAEADVYKADADILMREGELRLRQAADNLQALLGKVNALIEASRGGASVAAQLAAGAMSSVNLSASLSASGSANFSASASNSTTNSATNSDSSSYSETDATSNNTSESTNYNYSGSV